MPPARNRVMAPDDSIKIGETLELFVLEDPQFNGSYKVREKGDIIMLGIGGFTPLDGFMTHTDWQGVCDGMKMANGLFWPIPVTLSTDDESVKAGSDIALVDGETGEIMATMTVTEKYGIDKAHECMQVYKTTDMDHPGVKMVMAQGKYNLAGPVKVLSTGDFK